MIYTVYISTALPAAIAASAASEPSGAALRTWSTSSLLARLRNAGLTRSHKLFVIITDFAFESSPVSGTRCLSRRRRIIFSPLCQTFSLVLFFLFSRPQSVIFGHRVR